MKKYTKIKLFTVVAIFLLSVSVLHAQSTNDVNYNTLVDSLPGIGGSTSLQEYLPAAFNLAIAVAAALAFVMITFGGITYATTDALNSKQQGREMVTNAIYGLLLVIGAYAILYTINPQILSFNLRIQRPVGVFPTTTSVVTAIPLGPRDPVTGVLPGYTLTQAQIDQNAQIRSALLAGPNPVGVNADPCANGDIHGCTNLVGLSQLALDSAKALKTACDTASKQAQNGACVIVITGGTEGGHSDHGPDRPNALDLSATAALTTYLSRVNPNDAFLSDAAPKNRDQVTIGNATYTYETPGANGRSTGAHWHVQYR